MRKIILASTSPRRKELLEKTGLPFEIVASNYEEDMTLVLPPHELAKHLSKGKADAALAASVFHFGECSIGQVKSYLAEEGIPIRR